MKIYGWDDTGPYRGELLAAQIGVRDLDFGLEMIAAELGWEKAFTAFADARKALVEAMVVAGADNELVQATKNIKASYVPVVAANE